MSKTDKPWKEVDVIVHEETHLAVRITKRVKGPAAYNMEIVFERAKDRYTNFIPVGKPAKDAEYQLEDVVRALVEEARRRIEALLAKEPKRNDQKKGGQRRDGKKKEKKATGLSALAKKDAEKGGHNYVGRTQRKKDRSNQPRGGA